MIKFPIPRIIWEQLPAPMRAFYYPMPMGLCG